MDNNRSLRSKRFTWTKALESIVIQVWKDNITDLRKSKHNGHVYKKICMDIEKTAGTVVTVKEITTKIKNLTRKYKHEREKIEKTGGTPSSWYMYDKIDAILGCFLSQNIMMEESIKTEPEDIDSDIFPSVVGSENLDAVPLPESSDASLDTSLDTSVDVKDLRPKNRVKKRNYQELLLEEFKRANAISEALAQEANDIQRTANNLLEKSLRIQEKILEKLK